MVNLTRIYTRTGDDGTTNLGDMSRTGKNDPRLKAYADVDEANCAIGLAISAGTLRADIIELLTRVQNELFDLGADLSTPIIDNPQHEPLRITEEYVSRLEDACDKYNDELEPLRSFILPGGSIEASHLHLARTVSRRAERSTWAAIDMYHGGVNQIAATYLNRLSDLLFILARVANKEIGDVLWQPGATRK
jgi:cob(I)alamin adenosyltransferase